MDPKTRARIDAGVGGAAFALSLLRGKEISEAQADARVAVGIISPLVEEALPHVEAVRAAREVKRAARQSTRPACKTSGCHLAVGHALLLGRYHEDENGVLFSEEIE